MRVSFYTVTPGLFFLAVVLLCCVAGCAYLFPGIKVRVALPHPPHPWMAAGAELRYRIHYLGEGGELRSVRLPPGRRELLLSLPRRLCNPVVAQRLGSTPVVAGGFLQPARGGGLITGGGRRLQLSWRDGAAAQLLLELLAAGAVPDVDGPALSRRMEREGRGDPWRCYSAELRTALGYALYNLNHIDALPLDDVRLPLATVPGERWLPANPLFKGELEVLAGGLQLTGIYPGLHGFYSPERGAALLSEVKKNGEVRLIIEPLRDTAR